MLMGHRGPDAQRVLRVTESAFMGHVRLSVIDLSSASDQPFELLDRYVVVYNGEIFNYRELRAELEAFGAMFKSDGDTEVVAWAYHFWGAQSVQRFNGMWAIGVYDRINRSLFLSRDRFGEKPLYYSENAGFFAFSSEVKSLLAISPGLASPNMTAIASFVRTSVGAQHDATWFQGISRLTPGCNLLVSSVGVAISRYWEYPTGDVSDVSEVDAIREYRELFIDSVKLRLRSDVPFGLTLSSGIDSSSIACVMQAVHGGVKHAFTAGFRPSEYRKSEHSAFSTDQLPIDEAAVAARLCGDIGLSANIIDIDYGNLVSQLSTIVWHLEAGNSSPAVIPLMQLMAAARREVTVVLEGQGADELLCGYVSAVLWPGVADALRSGSIGDAVRHIRAFQDDHSVAYALKIALRNLSNRLPSIHSAYQRKSGTFSVLSPELRSTTALKDWPPFGESPATDKFGSVGALLRRQHTGGLVNLLHYGDALSMANAVESRMPFLDHRLVEYCWKLPQHLKFRDGIGKWIHREAMKGLVPHYILDAKRKLGFTTPIADKFSGDGRSDEDPLSVLRSVELKRRGIFDAEALGKLIDRHRHQAIDAGNLLFRATLVELWFRRFIDRDWSAKR
jgi:asparagine synthase (glutamine-hydrolysing)